MHRLRDAGNTLVVVEHDPKVMQAADRVLDIGPGPGEHGGEIVFFGPIAQLAAAEGSLTADYLLAAGASRHRAPRSPVAPRRGRACGCKALPSTTSRTSMSNFPSRRLVCVTGVSGSGKSTLVHDILYPALLRDKGKPTENPGRHRALLGAEQIDDVVMVDQSRIGRTTRSNPASYVGAFDAIRDLFAQAAAGARTQVHAGYIQLQRRQRPLSGVRRQRLRARGDAIPLGCVPALSGLRRPALSRGSARSKVAARRGTAEKHRRCSRSDGLRGAGILRRRHGSVRAPGAAGRRRSRLPAPRSARTHAVGRRGAAAQAGRSSRRECRAPKDRERRGGAPRLARRLTVSIR